MLFPDNMAIVFHMLITDPDLASTDIGVNRPITSALKPTLQFFNNLKQFLKPIQTSACQNELRKQF